MSKRKVIFASLVILAMSGLLTYLIEPSISSIQARTKLTSRGAIKVVGVKAYSESGCSSILSSVDWGTLEPGASKSSTCYVRNEGNSVVALSLSTANWSPSNASQFITLKWDYEGRSIPPSEVVKVTFTLTVLVSIWGITNFSFDIIIIGTG